MTEDQDHDHDRDHDMLLWMAEFDHYERGQSQLEDEPEDEPDDDALKASLLAALGVAAAADTPDDEGREPPATVSDHDDRPAATVHWLRPALAGAAVAAAVAAGLWLTLRPAPPTDPEPPQWVAVGPHALQLGGTARLLGAPQAAAPDTPRAYGPGDTVLVRALPSAASQPSAAADGRVYAVPHQGGQPRLLPWSAQRADDGALEFSGPVTNALPPGVWRLEVELGPAEQCQRDRTRCYVVSALIEVVPASPSPSL